MREDFAEPGCQLVRQREGTVGVSAGAWRAGLARMNFDIIFSLLEVDPPRAKHQERGASSGSLVSPRTSHESEPQQ